MLKPSFDVHFRLIGIWELDMDGKAVLRQIARASYHKDGLRCARLFDVDPEFFLDLQHDVARLAAENIPSEVNSRDHITNWVRPIGRPVQFSLLNASGDFSDTSVDHDQKVSGKRFHHADRYPTLGKFIELFPGLMNMRLNGMSPGGGLSPHEEHVVRFSRRRYYLRARFHLPIATNPDSRLLLDGHWFHFDEGGVYFFNNGCIHSAVNGGEMLRYHLVWDMALSKEVVSMMFGEDSHFPLVRCPESSRTVPILSTEPVGKYAISGPGERLYRKLQLERVGLQAHRWQNGYQRLAFWRYAVLGKTEYDTYR